MCLFKRKKSLYIFYFKTFRTCVLIELAGLVGKEKEADLHLVCLYNFVSMFKITNKIREEKKKKKVRKKQTSGTC